MESYKGKTLKQIADIHGASVSDYNSSLIVASAKESKGMYFNGDVILHLSVNVDDCGLNRTGKWPFYLVDDNGSKKILSA